MREVINLKKAEGYDYLNKKMLAEVLGISVSTLNYRLRQGRTPDSPSYATYKNFPKPFRDGNKYVWDKARLLHYFGSLDREANKA